MKLPPQELLDAARADASARYALYDWYAENVEGARIIDWGLTPGLLSAWCVLPGRSKPVEIQIPGRGRARGIISEMRRGWYDLDSIQFEVGASHSIFTKCGRSFVFWGDVVGRLVNSVRVDTMEIPIPFSSVLTSRALFGHLWTGA